jgi:seryl-tRNA(Sec) selenium transferase
VHTNFGWPARRGPSTIATIGSNYSNLEYDLAGGTAGVRRISSTGSRCCGAEAATVVNNTLGRSC